MKVCVIQPEYSYDKNDLSDRFMSQIALLDKCTDDLDIIVLPEYTDVPVDMGSGEAFHSAIRENNKIILEKARETAKRCSSIVFVNAASESELGYRNTTYAIDREGNIVGKYFKAHPAPSEVKSFEKGGNGLDVEYSYEFEKPYTLTLEGIRFAFMTCYDFYFYENFARVARENVDIIIGCSHQRTDSHEALSIINRFLCYNTNAYLIRASVSLGEDSGICGCSCVINPKGEEIVNMKSRVGLAVCEIDPKDKYYKPAGYKGALKAHYEYIEDGRRPWLYRNAGSSVVMTDKDMPYPRICAHRGFSTVAPENTMPSLGAAVAMGAEEIEFDIWSSSDGVLVSCHDSTLERVSNGQGKIYEHTYEELASLDFGAKSDERFGGLKIATFEEILKKFASRVIMNIHVKIWDMGMEDDKMEEIVALIRKYDCEKHVYFMTSNDDKIRKVMKYAPDIAVCVGWNGDKDPLSMVRRAKELGAYKIQLFKPYFSEETVRLAKENGILCNVFFADDPDEAVRYRKMGIETVLTNDYLRVKNALEEC
ncbi:MAG: hypothetical protein IJF55_01315 [Clostridia bacterium]|nr:hypothetical protein [Clostridia bacterium]